MQESFLNKLLEASEKVGYRGPWNLDEMPVKYLQALITIDPNTLAQFVHAYQRQIKLQDLEDVREFIQDDLIALLDNFSEKLVENACQIVVDNFQPLIEKVRNK